MDSITDTNRDEPLNVARVGESLPKAMGPREMAAAFGYSYHWFRKHERAGHFRPFELPRPIGRLKWSGEKVQAFLNGRK